MDAFHYRNADTTTCRGILALTIVVGRCTVVDYGCFGAPSLRAADDVYGGTSGKSNSLQVLNG